MDTKLKRISEIFQNNPKGIFTLIGHLINKDMLKLCHNEMDKNKAIGIDRISKELYHENLEENIDKLVEALESCKSYKPQPFRQVLIPKENGKTRPLGIAVYEDKLVQQALKKVLEAVFEPWVRDCMYGFRPGRSCHAALKRLNTIIEHAKPFALISHYDVYWLH